MTAAPVFFGRAGGREVYKYVLRNARGTQAAILTLGGIIQEFSIWQNGVRRQLVVSLDNAESYVCNPFQINKQIGRVAGRIQNASFEINGQVYRVPANEGRHALHGGANGLGSQILEASAADPQELALSTVLQEAADGYPNNLKLTIRYRLTDDNRLEVHYQAEAEGDTVFDPTVHIYWQLAEGLGNGRLNIPAGRHIPADSEKLPAYPPYPENALFDFSDGRQLDEAVAQLRANMPRQGFDDIYQVEPNLNRPAAVLEMVDGCRIKIFSDRNGLVLFTACPANPAKHNQGIYDALATEAQTLPNSLHRPEFGEIRMRGGETKQTTIVYQIETH
ncbi:MULTISPECIES: galactose mutarotase [unclassified Neisseria]|uniref:aldose epimerase family protein n=1 Tax=unclassified Neisseria TaxID=2623750 RepID=UPI001072DF0D|nr:MULTISPECIES: galactose mutarotase [unclassified Neisseria]MBF0803711.1 galactose mutarotase [Neisseria sp. 19428wB4_WF04]TFU43618.1 galactose mutarotase [Neisseria sp. WF04]